MSTLEFLGEKCYDTHMVMHTLTRTPNFSLASEFQKHLSTAARKHGVIDQVKYKNGQVNENGQKGNIMFRMMLM